MIDTDKYEGHTPGPWSFGEDWLLLAEETFDCETVCSDLSDATEVDAQLMADAPLLLAEVKRLQINCDAMSEMIQWYMETGEMLDRDDWDAKYEAQMEEEE